jgi:hypothetical protein
MDSDKRLKGFWISVMSLAIYFEFVIHMQIKRQPINKLINIWQMVI